MMLYLQNIKNMKQKMYDKHKKQMTIFRLNYLGYMFFSEILITARALIKFTWTTLVSNKRPGGY